MAGFASLRAFWTGQREKAALTKLLHQSLILLANCTEKPFSNSINGKAGCFHWNICKTSYALTSKCNKIKNGFYWKTTAINHNIQNSRAIPTLPWPSSLQSLWLGRWAPWGEDLHILTVGDMIWDTSESVTWLSLIRASPQVLCESSAGRGDSLGKRGE